MTVIVYLNEARQHTFSAGPKHLMRLNPGSNIVDENDLKQCMKHSESLKSMVENDVVVVHGNEVDPRKMKVPEVLQLVDMETTVEGLFVLLEKENEKDKPRSTIIDAIEAKIQHIESGLESGATDKPTED